MGFLGSPSNRIKKYFTKYDLQVFSTGNGSVSGTGKYRGYQYATISALENDGYHFKKWSDETIDNPKHIQIVDNLQISAFFERNNGKIKFYASDGEVVQYHIDEVGTPLQYRSQIAPQFAVISPYQDNEHLSSEITGDSEIDKVIKIEDFYGEITEIGGHSFYKCSELSDIKLPEVEIVGGNVFEGCSSLVEVKLEECDSIGNEAFKDCSELSLVDISKCTEIKDGAFENCGNLDTLVLSGQDEPPTLGEDVFKNANEGMKIIVKDEAYTKYLEDEKWNKLSNIIYSESRIEINVEAQKDIHGQPMGLVYGSGVFNYGVQFQISAEGLGENEFIRWNDGSVENPRTLTATESQTYTAIFEDVIGYVIFLENY